MVGVKCRVWPWAAAALFGGYVAEAAAQQPLAPTGTAPTRAVSVSAADGNPKVYYVTGTAQPEKLPPVAEPAPFRPMPAPVGSDAPVVQHNPMPALVAPSAPATAPTSAACATGRCGHGGHLGNRGLSSWYACMRTPATIPPPLGSSVRGAFDMQRDNALAEYFVVYREDWLDARAVLNDTGTRHVDGIVRRITMIGAPIKVEPTGLADLDARRRAAVAELLVQAGMPADAAAARVIAGTTRAEGLRYREIEAIYNNTGGTPGSGYGAYGAYGGFGGFSGYGFGLFR